MAIKSRIAEHGPAEDAPADNVPHPFWHGERFKASDEVPTSFRGAQNPTGARSVYRPRRRISRTVYSCIRSISRKTPLDGGSGLARSRSISRRTAQSAVSPTILMKPRWTSRLKLSPPLGRSRRLDPSDAPFARHANDYFGPPPVANLKDDLCRIEGRFRRTLFYLTVDLRIRKLPVTSRRC